MGAKELIKRLYSAEKFTIVSFTFVTKGLMSMKGYNETLTQKSRMVS